MLKTMVQNFCLKNAVGISLTTIGKNISIETQFWSLEWHNDVRTLRKMSESWDPVRQLITMPVQKPKLTNYADNYKFFVFFRTRILRCGKRHNVKHMLFIQWIMQTEFSHTQTVKSMAGKKRTMR